MNIVLNLFFYFCIFINQAMAFKLFPLEENQWGKRFAAQIYDEGHTDFIISPIEKGFIAYTLGPQKQKYALQFEVRENISLSKFFEITENGNRLLVEEKQTKFPQGVLLVETQRRIAINQYTVEQKVIRKKRSYDETNGYDELIWNTIGYPSNDQLNQRRKTINTLWEKEYSGFLCRNSEVLPLAQEANWSSDMKKIMASGNYSELMSFIDTESCGEDFVAKDGPLDTALNVGISCLQEMGGEGAALAAKMVGIIVRSPDLSPSGKRLKFDCRQESVKQQLFENGKQVANGVATNQCEENWPEIVIAPGAGGNDNDVGRQTMTTFHEMFHLLGFYHGQGIDRTNWCSFACFGVGFGTWKGNDVSGGADQSDYINKAQKYCSGQDTQFDAEYSIDFEVMMENTEKAKNVATLNSLYSPSVGYAEHVSQNFFSSADQGVATAWLIAYGYASTTPVLEEVKEMIIESKALSKADVSALKWATTADRVNREADIEHSAEILKTLYLKVKKKNTTELTALGNEFHAELVSGLEALWRGFCQRRKDQIKAKEFCLEGMEFDPLFSGY